MMKLLEYKKSNFNIIIDDFNGSYIIFNTLTGSIGRITNDERLRFDSNSLTDDEINLLMQKGILIHPDYDENEKIDKDRMDGMTDDTRLYVRVWPTSSCNANCYYCFEKGMIGNNMSIDVAKQFVAYLKTRASPGKDIDIQWFGGEPLLNDTIIDYIVDEIQQICEKNNSKYGGVVISNGSLITKELAQRMRKKWHIYRTQITLDGYKDQYNNVKAYNQPNMYNFDTVISNIGLLADTGMHVTIRMNYDTHNYESLKELIHYLHKVFSDYKNISYYIYPVWSSFNLDMEDAFKSNTNADLKMLDLFNQMVEYNMCSLKGITRLGYRPVQCDSCNKNSFSVLPNGNITKCCEVYQQIIGNVWDGINNNELFDYWISPKLDEKCTICQYLPICQGGCKASHFNPMPQCFAYKPMFEDMVRWYVKRLDKIASDKGS